ncbi:MAG: response regulator [Bacteroidota bacterium]|nr:response regulator [Bacteroidota bacterium]
MKQFKNIMLIDDDPINNLISSKTIQIFDPEVSITEYDDPSAALEYLKAQSKERNQNLPDVIFLDINMPVINGWNFLEEYKHLLQYLNKDIELFLLTSSTNHKDMQKAKSFPIITHYISKPLTIEGIKSIVNLHYPKK